MSPKKSSVLALSIVLLAAGCGGSGGSGGAGGSTTVGQMSVVYTGQPQPAVSGSSGSITVAGLAGAGFSTITFNPTPNINDTMIVFQMGNAIEMYSVGSGAFSVLPTSFQIVSDPAISGDGRIAFIAFDTVTQHNQIFTCCSDGSHLVKISTTNTEHESPDWSPDNSKIVFVAGPDLGGPLKTVPSSGGAEIALGQQGVNPVYSPDGTRIAFEDANTEGQIDTIPASGGSETLINSGSFQSYQCFQPAWTPDSKSILVSINLGGQNAIFSFDASGSGQDVGMTSPPAGDNDVTPVVAPDMSQYAFVRQTQTGEGLYTSQMVGLDSVNRLIGTNANGDNPSNPRWSHFLANQKFIGAGGTNVTAGTMATTSSGFLFGENGTSFASFLSFTGRTAAQATITPQTTSGGALVFLLKADSITGLSYTNGYYLPAVTSTPSVPQVLVSFDGTTGKVGNTIPLIMQGSPQAKNGQITYRGQIPAIYDASGNNLARNGASEVTIDARTGRLVSWR